MLVFAKQMAWKIRILLPYHIEALVSKIKFSKNWRKWKLRATYRIEKGFSIILEWIFKVITHIIMNENKTKYRKVLLTYTAYKSQAYRILFSCKLKILSKYWYCPVFFLYSIIALEKQSSQLIQARFSKDNNIKDVVLQIRIQHLILST